MPLSNSTADKILLTRHIHISSHTSTRFPVGCNLCSWFQSFFSLLSFVSAFFIRRIWRRCPLDPRWQAPLRRLAGSALYQVNKPNKPRYHNRKCISSTITCHVYQFLVSSLMFLDTVRYCWPALASIWTRVQVSISVGSEGL